MFLPAATISLATHVTASRVFLPYLGAWSSLTLLAVLVWIFVRVAALAPQRADQPLQTVIAEFKQRDKAALWISALVFPLFLGSYTWAKCSLPLVVDYRWECFWADIDKFMLGDDAWRAVHAIIPSAMASSWSFFYAVIWGMALATVGALVAAFCRVEIAIRFFTAMMLSWLIGGFVLAYLIPAAGPVFAHLADPDLAPRFAPLRDQLIGLLGRDDIVMTSQRYLELGFGADQAVKGGGISAMPSMHIATATIFICAAWNSRWLILALPFWLLTFIGSIYLGYHYAIDAPVAAIVAVGCWSAAIRIYHRRSWPERRAVAGDDVATCGDPLAL